MKNKKVTIKEIAQNTGVSLGTVHRVIYGKEGVGEETRQRVLAEIERTNYQINTVAASMNRKPMVIVVVLQKCEGDERFFFRGIWKGVKEAAEKLKEYKMEFRYIESEYGLSKISLALQELFDSDLREVGGIVTVVDDDETGMWVRRFQKQGIMVVAVSSYSEKHGCLCSLRIKHEIAGALAAEFLDLVCEKKDGKIIVLTGNKGIYSNRNYAEGFLEYEKKHGDSRRLLLVEGFGSNEIADPCRKLLQEESIAGIFSCTARNTYSICKVLEEMNRTDVCLIGTDVFYELEEYFQKGIIKASIYQSTVEQGREAVEVLYRYLASSELEEKNIYLPVGIVMKNNYSFYIS